MTNPFAGPRPIAQSEPIFGRDREITELRHLLIAERLVLLHSPSGAGKTSLINAGLIPEFAVHFAVCPPTRVIFEMPGVYDKSVICSAQIGGSPRPGDSLADVLLHDFIASLPTGKNKLLILDHFESAVRPALANPGWHTGFFRQLGQLLNDPSIWALISLREDFVAPILPLLDYIPTRLRARYRLGFLSRAHAERAMRDTARTSGIRQFADGAAARLAASLSCVNVQNPDGSFTLTPSDTVEPLQLQVVCRRLWDGMPDDDLSIDPVDLDKFGDVVTALGAYYDDSVARQDPVSQRAIREWFEKHLITPGGIRGQVRRGHNHSEGLDNAVIDQLLETHLVRAELRGTVTWYELAHDSLIAPVLASNNRWYEANLSPFQRRAAIWLANGQADPFLLTGEPLAEAELWHKANFFLATTDENEFLEKSREKQAALDREADLRRRLVHTTVNAELERALTAPDTAAALAHLAYALRVQPANPVVRARIYDLLQRTALWLPQPSLATPESLKVHAFSPDGTLALAGNDVFAYRPFTRLWDTRTGQPASNQPQFSGCYDDGAFSPDGRFLFALASPGGAELFHLTQPQPAPLPLPTLRWPFRGIFSPNSARLLVLSRMPGDAATLFDPATAQPIGNPIPNTYRAAFSPDSTKLVTWSETNSAHVWDAATAEPIGDEITHPVSIRTAIFTPDSAKVLTATPDPNPQFARFSEDARLVATITATNEIQIWNTATAEPLCPPIPQTSPSQDHFFTPDNRTLLNINQERTLQFWDSASGRPIGLPIPDFERPARAFHPTKPHLLPASRRRNEALELGYIATGIELAPAIRNTTPGHLAAWSPDGKFFAIANWSSAQMWDAQTLTPIGEFIATDRRIAALSFRPDGSLLLTPAARPALKSPIKETVYLSGVSPDGSWEFTVESSQPYDLLTIWSPDGTLEIPMPIRIVFAEFSSDGRSLLTQTATNELQVWCAQTGARIGQPIRPEPRLNSALFSPGNSFVLTLSSNGLAQLWDALTGLPAARPFHHRKDVYAAAFSPDSSLVLIAGLEVPAQLRVIHRDDDADLLADLAEAVGGQTLNAHDAVIPLADHAAALRAIPRESEWIAKFLPE